MANKNFEVKHGLSVGGTERITSAGVGTFTDLNVTGTTTTIDTATTQTVDLGNGDRIRLGDGNDLQIFHDGSNSFINNTSGDAGALSLKSHDINLMTSASETMAVFTEDLSLIHI